MQTAKIPVYGNIALSVAHPDSRFFFEALNVYFMQTAKIPVYGNIALSVAHPDSRVFFKR